MQQQYREEWINLTFSFVSWLRSSFPDMKDRILEESFYPSFGEMVRTTPMMLWADVGRYSLEELSLKSVDDESILDRVVAIVREASPAVQNEILVGFVEAHMFRRPDSPLANELGKALDMDLSDLC